MALKQGTDFMTRKELEGKGGKREGEREREAHEVCRDCQTGILRKRVVMKIKAN
jgi:hypothetical protein